MKSEQVPPRQNQPEQLRQATASRPQQAAPTAMAAPGGGPAAPVLRVERPTAAARRGPDTDRARGAAGVLHLLSAASAIAGTCIAAAMTAAGGVLTTRAIDLISAPAGPLSFAHNWIGEIVTAKQFGPAQAAQVALGPAAQGITQQVWQTADILGMLAIGLPLLITGLDHLHLPAMFSRLAGVARR